jgi:peptidyl-prolyl cis-trans isomerase SurA
MRHYFSFVGLLFVTSSLFSQTLFTYGNKTVTKKDFLTAFEKNPPSKTNRRKALDEYLGLYINYRLKVQAGYDDELNKQPSFIQESKTFKKQIAENIINEEVGLKRLTDEAIIRGKKDIHAGQVFIEVKTPNDSAKAFKQINDAYKALLEGKPFAEVAASFSTDPATIQNKGDLGFITVFTFSYPIETEIYKLKPGTFSKPYRSSFGYHIFKNISERPALGKRKIAQIRFATPKGFSKDEKNEYSILADSIYNLLKKGESFEKFVKQYSSDNKTVPNGGVIGYVGVGDYEPDFEKEVFSLQNVGDISKPFATKFGYHIIKLLDKKPAVASVDDAIGYAAVKQVVEKDERLEISKKNLLENKWLALTKYKPGVYDANAFISYTDSNLLHKITNGIKEIKDTTVLFSFEKKKIYAADWAVYITEKQKNKVLPAYSKQLKEFVNKCCLQYYTDNLELYSDAMKEQLKEFDEANVLFAAMDKHVWSKSASSLEELKNYYNAHKEKYQWKESATALLINSTSKSLALSLVASIKKAPQDWRKITSNYGPEVNADSGRYEIAQLPLKGHVENKDGFIGTPEKNPKDSGYTFIYIIKSYPQKEQRTFEDAKGAVTNDYQQELEEKWLASLKKKYPIKVNEAVWKTIQ